MAHFALVPASSPIQSDRSHHVAASSEDNSGDGHPSNQEDQSIFLRREITQIYESHASLYPNPALIQERQERDALLRALQAAEHQREISQPKTQQIAQEKSRGWFGLFSSNSEKQRQKSTSQKKKEKSHNLNPYDGGDDDDDDRLLYSDLIDEDDDLTDPLCGTQRGLDLSCIPREAHLQARFCCISKKAHSPINLARHSASEEQEEAAGLSSSTILIVGLGQLVEMVDVTTTEETSRESSRRQMQTQFTPQLQCTGDRAALLQHVSNLGWTFKPEQARAAIVGPNLLCISWGLCDGLVVLYRRTTATKKNLANDDNEVVMWQSVAMSSPTPQVLSHVRDELLLDEEEEEGRQEITTPLLLVTDVLPLVLDVALSERIDEHADSPPPPPPFFTMAIARLGGYVELVPVPAKFWYGPPLESSRIRIRKNNVHYAAQLPNLSHGGGDRVLAMTTVQYHNDVLGLSAFATRVAARHQQTFHENEDIWNQALYPDHPPSQFVLSAHGFMDGTERLSFWCVGFVPIQKQQRDDPLGYTLYSSVLEVLEVGMLGPALSIFATKEILRFWRKAKGVELNPSMTSNEGTDTAAAAPVYSQHHPQLSSALLPITTISVASPILRVEFFVSGQAALLVVLDANGGVTYMDCARLERLASQSLTEHEYIATFESHQHQPLPLVEPLIERPQVRQRLLRVSGQEAKEGPKIVSIRFLPRELVGPFDNKPTLAMVVEGIGRAGTTLLFCPMPDLESEATPLCVPLSMTIYASHAALHCIRRHGLQMVGCCRNPSSNGTSSLIDTANFCVHSIQELNPSDIVRSLECSGKLQEALDAANQLGIQERESISDTVESVQKRLWEREFNILALKSIADDAYVITQALQMCKPYLNLPVPDDLEDYRSVITLALKRLSWSRLATAASLGGPESVEKAKVRLQNTLLHLGTYQLLGRVLGGQEQLSPSHFLTCFSVITLSDLAIQFAENGDVACLSLLVFRHWRELVLDAGTRQEGWEWIRRLPPTLPPGEYAHLLPVLQKDEEDSAFNVVFVDGVRDFKLRHIQEMPRYLQEEFEVCVVLGEESELKTLLTSITNCLQSTEALSLFIDCLDKALARRAEILQSFTGSLESTGQLCQIGAISNSLDGNGNLVKLGALNKEMEAVRRAVIPTSGGASLTKSMSVLASQLQNRTTASERLHSLLGACRTVSEMVQILDVVRPLILIAGGNDEERPLDLISFCLQAVTLPPNINSLPKLLDGACLCSAIATLSRTSLPFKERLIGDKFSLTRFVHDVIFRSSVLVSRLNVEEIDLEALSHLVDVYWTLFESLPVKMAGVEESKEDSVEKLDSDKLYSVLSATEMATAWGDPVAIRLCVNALVGKNTIEQSLAVRLCRSCFCQIVDSSHEFGENSFACVEIISALLSDLGELASIFKFHDKRKELVTNCIFIPLLRAEKIELLSSIVSRSREGVFDALLVSDEIARSLEDEMHSPKGSSNVQLFEKCRDFLGPFFPQLEGLFGSLQLLLDASNCFNSIHRGGDFIILPRDIKERGAIEVIELLLERNPQSVVSGCDEWVDAESSAVLNNAIREINESERQGQESNPHLPRLPGQEVFGLAEILQLVRDVEVIIVKCRVASTAKRAGYHGACAALCRNLIVTEWSERTRTAMKSTILSEVHTIVSCKEYSDMATKRELCQLVLSYCWQGASKQYNGILEIWASLEYGSLPTLNTSSSLGSFYAETMAQYSVDVYGMFDKMSQKALGGCQSEEFLETLSKYSLLWSAVVESSDRACDGPSTLSDIGDVGLWLLLHLQDRSSAAVLLHDLINETKAKAERAAASFKSHLHADGALVLLLQQHGYSRNGAIRAAVSAPNIGFNQAMQWAVMHSIDPDFNTPLIRLKSSGSTEHHLQYLRQIVRWLERTQVLMDSYDSFRGFLESRDTLSLSGHEQKGACNPSFLSSSAQSRAAGAEAGKEANLKSLRTNRTPIVLIKVNSQNHNKSDGDRGSRTSSGLNAIQVAETARSRRDKRDSGSAQTFEAASSDGSYVPRLESAPRLATSMTMASGSETLNEMPRATRGVFENVGPEGPELRSLECPVEKPHTQSSSGTHKKPSPAVSMPAFVTQSAPPSLGSPLGRKSRRSSPTKLSPSERHSCRQKGQAFLQRMRANVRNKGNNDRQRLIDQGRQVLQRARKESTAEDPTAQTLSAASTQLEALTRANGIDESLSRSIGGALKRSSSPFSTDEKKIIVEKARALRSGDNHAASALPASQNASTTLADRGRQLLEQARASDSDAKHKLRQHKAIRRTHFSTSFQSQNQQKVVEPTEDTRPNMNYRVENERQASPQCKPVATALQDSTRAENMILSPQKPQNHSAPLSSEEAGEWDFDDRGTIVGNTNPPTLQAVQLSDRSKQLGAFPASTSQLQSTKSENFAIQSMSAVEENGWDFDEVVDAEVPKERTLMENENDKGDWSFDDGLNDSNEEESNQVGGESSRTQAKKLEVAPSDALEEVNDPRGALMSTATVSSPDASTPRAISTGGGDEGWDFANEGSSRIPSDGDLQNEQLVSGDVIVDEAGWGFDDDDAGDIDLC